MKKFITLSALLLVIAGCGTNESAEEVQSETVEETEQVAEQSNDKNVIETDEFKMTLTDMWIEDSSYDNGEIVAIEYEIENKTDEEMPNDHTLLMAVFDVIQDNDPNIVNRLDYESPKDFGLEGYARIKPGGTSVYGMGYTLTDNETPITIKVSEFAGEEIYSEEFDITEMEKR